MDGLLPTALAVFVALPQKEGGFCLTGELELSGGSTGAASASASTELNTWWVGA